MAASRHWSSRPARSRTTASVRLPDFSSSLRTAKSLESLYQSLVEAVARAFSIPVVSLFVGDEPTGSFRCCASTASSVGNAADDHELTLPPDSFVIRRLRNLTSALQLDPAELEAWQQALRDAPVSVQKKRMQERDILLQTKASLLVQLKIKSDLLGVLAVGEGPGRRLTADDRDRLRTAIVETARQSSREILDHILNRVSMWSSGALQHDDITVVVLKITE